MKLNIQFFGGRGANSGNVIKIKKDTFTTATRIDNKREDIKVQGVSFKYKSIGVGVFNRTQKNYPDETRTRGKDKFIAVIRTNNKANGTMLTTGKTQKEAVQKSMKLIDDRKQDIIRAIGGE